MAINEQIDLSSAEVTGNLATSHLNSGTGAGSTTFWRGDGTWVAPALPIGTLNMVTLNLTNAQIKALNTTPIPILANQGAGVVIVPVQIIFKLIYGGTNAFVGGGTTNILYGVVANTNIIYSNTTTGFWTATTNNYFVPALFLSGTTTIFSNTLAENVAVSICTTTAITGNAAANNTAEVQMLYYTIAI